MTTNYTRLISKASTPDDINRYLAQSYDFVNQHQSTEAKRQAAKGKYYAAAVKRFLQIGNEIPVAVPTGSSNVHSAIDAGTSLPLLPPGKPGFLTGPLLPMGSATPATGSSSGPTLTTIL